MDNTNPLNSQVGGWDEEASYGFQYFLDGSRGGAAIHGYQLGIGELRGPGPGFIFFVGGLFLLILSLIELANIIITLPKSTDGDEEVPIWKGTRWQRVVFILLCLSAYAYFLEYLGFILSTSILMFLLYKCIEPTKWRFAILSTVLTVSITYLLLQVLLKGQFPQGIIRF